MALGVEVDFIGEPVSGEPPFVVQFTDLSVATDGFKRLWFWDFGDGESSTEQHPTHEYDGEGGESFDVKLRVFITDGEFDTISTQFSNAITAGSGSIEKNGFSLIGEPESWADYLTDPGFPFTSVFARHQLFRTGSTDRQYKNTVSDLSVSTGSPVTDGKIYTLACTPSPFTEYIGAANANGFNREYSNSDVRQFHSVISDIVQSVPWNFTASVLPEARLPDVTGPNQQRGLSVSWAIVIYPHYTGQLGGLETKEAYITIGTAPEAYFDAAPRVGPNNLWVQFENLSVPALGAETLYSWKRRLSGSGDPFVEFSTAENPLVLFIK
jgi:PKD repeat protein